MVFLCVVVSLVRFASGLGISKDPSRTFLVVASVIIVINNTRKIRCAEVGQHLHLCIPLSSINIKVRLNRMTVGEDLI